MPSSTGSRQSTPPRARGLGTSSPRSKECGVPCEPSGANEVDLCPDHLWLKGSHLARSELTQGTAPPALGADKESVPSEGEKEHVPTPPLAKPRRVRMMPACADCKKAKKRCVHRRPIDEGNVAAAPSLKRKRGPDAQAGDHDKDVADSQDVVAVVSAGALTGPVDVEAEAPLPPAKRRRRAGRQTTTKASGVALKMPTPLRPVLAPVTQQEQPRGSIAKRKRKLAEVIKESPLDAPQPPKDAAAAAGDSGVSTVEGSAPPRKRTRRATLLAGAEANATAAADAVADKNPVKNHPTVEPPVVAAEPGGGVTIAAPGQLALPPFPADSLEGSIHLARHQVMSRELGRRIDDCRVKWTAAIEALESARHLMDSWLELWKKGQ